MWAVVFAPSAANVTLKCGSSSSTFPVISGVNKFKIPLAPGGMSVKMVRNGRTIISETAPNYTYVLNPASCASSSFYPNGDQGFLFKHLILCGALLDNYNAYVGSASKFLLNLLVFYMP